MSTDSSAALNCSSKGYDTYGLLGNPYTRPTDTHIYMSKFLFLVKKKSLVEPGIAHF